MAQQTAVEWLVDKLQESGIHLMKDELEMIQQAKQMEKEQIGNSWVDGYKNYKEVLNHSRLEQYYNETFSK